MASISTGKSGEVSGTEEDDDEEDEDEDDEEDEDEEEEEEEEEEQEQEQEEEQEGQVNGSSSASKRGVDEVPKRDGVYGRHLKVLCLNTYLIPPSISWNPHLWAPFWSCKRPGARALQIGKLAAANDLICLQEVWGTHMNAMNDAVAATHSILPECQSFSRMSLLNEVVDPMRFYFNKTGGMWFGWRRSKLEFRAFDRMHFKKEGRIPFSNQNVTVVEFDAGKCFPGKRLLVFGTHFSIWGAKARKVNMECLKSFVKKTLWKTYVRAVAARSMEGENRTSDPVSVMNDLGVLLCGDFNVDINRSPSAYRRLKTLGGLVEMRDLFLPANNRNYHRQRTYYTQEQQGTVDNPGGNSLFPWLFKGRVDYIFGIDEIHMDASEVRDLIQEFPPDEVLDKSFEDISIPLETSGSLSLSFAQIHCLGMDILTQKHGEELSDHWPLRALITIGPPDVTQLSSDEGESDVFPSRFRIPTVNVHPAVERPTSSLPRDPQIMEDFASDGAQDTASEYMTSNAGMERTSSKLSSVRRIPSLKSTTWGDDPWAVTEEEQTDQQLQRHYTLYDQQTEEMKKIPTAEGSMSMPQGVVPNALGVTTAGQKARALFGQREYQRRVSRHSSGSSAFSPQGKRDFNR